MLTLLPVPSLPLPGHQSLVGQSHLRVQRHQSEDRTASMDTKHQTNWGWLPASAVRGGPEAGAVSGSEQGLGSEQQRALGSLGQLSVRGSTSPLLSLEMDRSKGAGVELMGREG